MDKIAPLPVDATGKLAPLNDPASAIGAPAAVATTAADDVSVTDAWLAEHPVGAEFDESAAPAPITPPIPLEPETPPTEEVSAPEVVPPTETPAPEATPPTEAPAATEKPAEPATPAPKTYAADERIGLADGVEWTRQQIVDALQERVSLQALKPEAEGFQQIFRMNAEQAREIWGPIVERITADPEIPKFIDAYMSDPKKREYLDTCARYFDSENPQGAAPAAAPAPAKPAVDPALQRQITELTQWKNDRQKEAALTRFNNEVATVSQRYPFVVADPQLFEDLKLTASALWTQDNSKGLLDALALKAPMYEALAAARNAQTAQPAPAPALALVPQGAAPAASRPTPNTRAKKYADTDEATQAWLEAHPGDYKE